MVIERQHIFFISYIYNIRMEDITDVIIEPTTEPIVEVRKQKQMKFANLCNQ